VPLCADDAYAESTQLSTAAVAHLIRRLLPPLSGEDE